MPSMDDDQDLLIGGARSSAPPPSKEPMTTRFPAPARTPGMTDTQVYRSILATTCKTLKDATYHARSLMQDSGLHSADHTASVKRVILARYLHKHALAEGSYDTVYAEMSTHIRVALEDKHPAADDEFLKDFLLIKPADYGLLLLGVRDELLRGI